MLSPLTADAAVKVSTIIVGASIAVVVVVATGLVSAFFCWRRRRSREPAGPFGHATDGAVVTQRTATTICDDPKVDHTPQVVTVEEPTSELYGEESTGTEPPDETSDSNFGN